MLIIKVTLIIKPPAPKFSQYIFKKEPIHIAIKIFQLELASTTLEEHSYIKAR